MSCVDKFTFGLILLLIKDVKVNDTLNDENEIYYFLLTLFVPQQH